MSEHWLSRPILRIFINFFTKEHPPSGKWPSWQCAILPYTLTISLHFVIIVCFPQLLGQGGLSLLFGTGAKTIFQSLFASLFWGGVTTISSLDIYALIVRDKPERPWLWCLIAVLHWPVLFGIFAILAAIDHLRNI